jgi:hypothetical protein
MVLRLTDKNSAATSASTSGSTSKNRREEISRTSWLFICCPLSFTPNISAGLSAPGKRIFVVSLCRPIALGSAWLFHHTARTPLAHAMRITRMDHRTASSFRA